MRIWPVQYAWMMLNADVAAATHVNIGVVLLVGVCGLLIARAGQNRMALGGAVEGFPDLTPGACGLRE